MKTIDENAIERFSIHNKAKGRQKATVDSYQRDCETFLSFLSLEGVNEKDIEPKTLTDFQVFLKNRGIKENSVRRSVIGVRQFFRFLQEDYGWDQSPFDDVPIPERDEVFTHRILADQILSLQAAIRVESSPLKASRDLSMLLLLAHEGLKAAELIDLEWGDFIAPGAEGILRIRGPRSRNLALESETTQAVAALKKLLAEKELAVMIKPKSKIMMSFKGNDARHIEPELSRHGVKFALYELGNLVGISHLNSEDLRHFAMAHKVALGFTPEALMNHLGLRTPGKISQHFPDHNILSP